MPTRGRQSFLGESPRRAPRTRKNSNPPAGTSDGAWARRPPPSRKRVPGGATATATARFTSRPPPSSILSAARRCGCRTTTRKRRLSRINDDATETDQFFPAVSVSPTGVIDVVWYDRRHDPENRLLDLYHTYSLDGGRTWAPNTRVTEVSSDPVHSLHQGGFVFIGDYIDLDSSVDCAWPAWVDTRHGKADVMTACLERPSAVRTD